MIITSRSCVRAVTASVAGAAAVTLALTTAPSAHAVDGPAVTPELLPASDFSPVARAVDISPLGVVAGSQGPSGTQAAAPRRSGSSPVTWMRGPDGHYTWRQFTLPVGTTGGDATGITDDGQLLGTVAAGGVDTDRATRWFDTRRTQLAGPGSRVSAVGPDQWVVDSGVRAWLTRSTGEQVDLGATSPLDRMLAVGGASGASDSTALVAGFRPDLIVNVYVWRDNRVAALPVFNSPEAGGMCLSQIHPDSSVAYSGMAVTTSGVRRIVGVRRGDGTFQELHTLLRGGAIACDSRDSLAADGTVVGQLNAVARGSIPIEAAVWRADGGLVEPGRRTGEISTRAVAVATGGRVVLVASERSGQRVYLWRDGVHRRLTLPTGAVLDQVVEMTDNGQVLANVRIGARIRPVVWHTTG